MKERKEHFILEDKKLSERFADLIHPCPPSKVIEAGEILAEIQSLEKQLEEAREYWDIADKEIQHWKDMFKLHDTELKKLREGIEGLQNYIKILNHELDQTVSIAYIHGWRSELVEDGKQAREKLKELGIELNQSK